MHRILKFAHWIFRKKILIPLFIVELATMIFITKQRTNELYLSTQVLLWMIFTSAWCATLLGYKWFGRFAPSN